MFAYTSACPCHLVPQGKPTLAFVTLLTVLVLPSARSTLLREQIDNSQSCDARSIVLYSSHAYLKCNNRCRRNRLPDSDSSAIKIWCRQHCELRLVAASRKQHRDSSCCSSPAAASVAAPAAHRKPREPGNRTRSGRTFTPDIRTLDTCSGGLCTRRVRRCNDPGCRCADQCSRGTWEAALTGRAWSA